MRSLKILATTVLVALVLVASVDYAASAATGKPFILGKLNKTNKQTTLKRTTPGPALRLTTKSASDAPFTTNGTGKVAGLDADKLDGLDASALGTRSHTWRSTFANRTMVEFELPLAPGTYVVSYSQHFSSISLPATVYCQVRERIGGTDRYTAHAAFVADTGSLYPAMSGTGLVTKTSSGSVMLRCGSNHAFSADDLRPLEIVATPTSLASLGTLAPS